MSIVNFSEGQKYQKNDEENAGQKQIICSFPPFSLEYLGYGFRLFF